LRRIFGLKRNEVTGEWRKIHNEELNDRYFTRSRTERTCYSEQEVDGTRRHSEALLRNY
jgi:hypothetical protein